MTEHGGTADRAHIFFTDITDDAASITIQALPAAELPQLAAGYPANGFTVLIVPGLSPLLSDFAHGVPQYPDIFNAPLVGWISGVPVEEIGITSPKVFAGNGTAYTDHAAVMYVTIPPDKTASLDIINLFSPGPGPGITFETESFAASTCTIDGQTSNLASYIATHGIDTKLPLVADYNGAMINVSIQSTSAETVQFYAPVVPGIVYRFATPVPDYTATFGEAISSLTSGPPLLSCNCILNYLYANLEGKSTALFIGPITFGEIAYILLNQTLVYLTINDVT
jgi:hypothetical protein